MIKKCDGYEKSEAYTGEFEAIEPGGHICKILKVQAEEKDYGTLLRIGFDIAEGDNKDFYKRKLDKDKQNNPEAKWQGMYYQTIKNDENIKYFKGFMTAIEKSNAGYKWDWDEQKLVGKLFGGVFGQEEYLNSNQEVKLSTKCRFVRSVEQVKAGVQVPEIKRLNSSSPAVQAMMNTSDDELPF